MSKITPYNSSEDKKTQITQMFNNIAKYYDFLNHSLSFGMDHMWRKTAIRYLKNNPQYILDIATGTGDFAISAAKYTNAQITGIDISQGMLNIGMQKIKNKGLTNRINLQLEDSENLPFSNNKYDAVIVGFGVRNFDNLQKGLTEIYRVLKTHGIVTILEPSNPTLFPLKQLHNIYFHYILPFIGKIISKDKNAYTYLSKSVDTFPSRNDFLIELKKAGFNNYKHIPLTYGIVSLYIAIK